jgi:glycosyltransferase involved in cell wall biosynthesis
MDKVSILIPARGESIENLRRTLQSISKNATGEYEIIVGYDGSQDNYIEMGTNLKVVKFPEVVGIKTNINALASMAKGKYIYKSDAHCSFGKGFDEVLKADMQDDWIVMPRFKIIKDDWSIQKRNGKEEFYDYFYLCCPFTDPRGFRFKAGGHWPQKTQEKLDVLIDETPQIHGSGWFMTRDRFFELGGFPNIDPHGHAQEPIWLALKNWMAGGKVMVNKKTWYAHLHQRGDKRGYHMSRGQERASYDIAARYWVGNKWDDTWPKKKMSFEQFVDKFMPMPTWPDNWKEMYQKWISEN